MAETRPPPFPTTPALPHLQGPGQGPGQNPAHAEEVTQFRHLGWRRPPSSVASQPCTPTPASGLTRAGPPSPPQAAELELGLSQTGEETVTATGPLQHRRVDLEFSKSQHPGLAPQWAEAISAPGPGRPSALSSLPPSP